MFRLFCVVFAVAFWSLPSVARDMPARVDWMGAYLNQSKVGYSALALGTPETLPASFTSGFSLSERFLPGKHLLLYSNSHIDVKALGSRNQVEWRMVALLDFTYALDRFEFHLESGETEIRMSGEVQEDSVVLYIDSSGDSHAKSIAVPKGPVYVAEALPLRFASLLENGASIDGDYSILEPHQMTVSVWNAELEGREQIEIGGVQRDAYRVKQNAGGFFPIAWIGRDGVVLKEFAPLSEEAGFVSYWETEEQAKNREFINPLTLAGNGESQHSREPDLLHATSVAAGRRLSNPSQVRRMVVDLWNFHLRHPFPFSERQRNLARVEQDGFTEESPLRLEITTTDRASLRDSVPELPTTINAEYAEFLEEEPLVQTKHPEIVRLSRETTKGLESPWEKAIAILRWMEKNITTEFRITLPSALEVLHSRKGDCNEQSALFAALARASGIPTRICTGLVYQGGAFYYHAWNEVLVRSDPECWVAIDPALRQEIADATHIKFGIGGLSEQSYINGLIGKIRANILEIETDDPGQEPDEALRADDRG